MDMPLHNIARYILSQFHQFVKGYRVKILRQKTKDRSGISINAGTVAVFIDSNLFFQHCSSFHYRQLCLAVGYLVVHDHFNRPVKRNLHNIHKLVSVKMLA